MKSDNANNNDTNDSNDNTREKQVSSTLIHTGRNIQVTVDDVELPDGRRTKRDVVLHRGAVAILPIDANGMVIMVRQFRYPIGRTLLETPAGTLEEGETPDFCADRELQEETGYKAGHLERIGGVFLAPGYSSEFIHFFAAWDLAESRLPMDEDEIITTERINFPQFAARVASGEICDAKTIAMMYLARDKYPGKISGA